MKDRMVYIHAAYDCIQAIGEFTQGGELELSCRMGKGALFRAHQFIK